jgi:membrane protein DedA with SNARE-associated domain
MHSFIIDAIAQGGYFGIFLLMVLENVFPPIPSELIMGLGGVLVARGQMQYAPLMIAGTAGSVLGNYAWYWVGNRWGYERTRPFVERWGRWLTIDWQHVETATEFFQKHGQWVVFVLRFSPLMRTMISLPAGLSHMSVWRFLLFTTLGSAIWNILLVLGGTMLAGVMQRYESLVGWVIIGLIALGALGYVWRVVTWKPRTRPQ